MGNKGQRKRQKRISMQKSISIARKEHVWAIRTNPGAHKKELSVPLGTVIRDYLKLATNLREVKTILREKQVKVDGKVREDIAFCVGLFDVVGIDKEKKQFRMLLDKKQRIYAKEMTEKENTKIARIEHKHVTSKGIQVTTSDGRIFSGISARVGDSLKINFESNKVDKVLEMKEGASVYVIGGSHAGKTAKINAIIAGTQAREKLIKLEQNGEEFETIVKNIFVIEKTGDF